MEHIKQEFPVYGTGDYRSPVVEILQNNGSRISDFQYKSYHVQGGKPELPGLPATYVEKEDEAKTLIIELLDEVTGVRVQLLYTIFKEGGILTKSIRWRNPPCHVHIFQNTTAQAAHFLTQSLYS